MKAAMHNYKAKPVSYVDTIAMACQRQLVCMDCGLPKRFYGVWAGCSWLCAKCVGERGTTL